MTLDEFINADIPESVLQQIREKYKDRNNNSLKTPMAINPQSKNTNYDNTNNSKSIGRPRNSSKKEHEGLENKTFPKIRS